MRRGCTRRASQAVEVSPYPSVEPTSRVPPGFMGREGTYITAAAGPRLTSGVQTSVDLRTTPPTPFFRVTCTW